MNTIVSKSTSKAYSFIYPIQDPIYGQKYAVRSVEHSMPRGSRAVGGYVNETVFPTYAQAENFFKAVR